MLTPAFELGQDADFLKILIKARYAKVTEVEIFVDGNDFKFYAKPYFLRLQLPGRVLEDGREKAKYDVDTGSFEVNLPKETPGELFQGLDMLTLLLAPKGQRSAEQPGIEVTGKSGEAGEQSQDAEDDQGEIDWQVEQQPFQQEEDSLWGETSYGFANKRSGVFQRLQEELCDIVDVPSPDTTQLMERKQARESAENDKFDEEHYLADLYQDDSVIESLLAHKPPWHHEWRKLQAKNKQATKQMEPASSEEPIVDLTEDEKEQMRRLPCRHYLLNPEMEKGVLLSLVDIVFAYAYNVRTTLSENSVESAWTICKLSPTLSWLDWFTSLDEVVTVCCRRVLCYPLYRHWELANRVIQDVQRIFLLGRRRLLKCLLEVHRILAADEPRYILNELYITDYCVWVQSLSHDKIASIAAALKKVKISKSKIGFELRELEQAAKLAIQEESKEERDEDAVSSVHQHGYPHVLYEGLDSESTTNPVKQPDNSEENRQGYEAAESSGDCWEPVTNGQGDQCECATVEESAFNVVATKMSDLKLSGEASEQSSKCDEKEKETDTVSKATLPVSLEDWARKPPSRKIEVFGEESASCCSEKQTDFVKGSADKIQVEDDGQILSDGEQREIDRTGNVFGKRGSKSETLHPCDPESVADLGKCCSDAKSEECDPEVTGCVEREWNGQSHGKVDTTVSASDSESDSESSDDSDSDSSTESESELDSEPDS
ncbi:protein SHQ1 homolog [Patiria miniata]|uniref:Protein SHQ1 homolog n=1 Tax=Patiria miniata TaxID=46514 RepID=A0A913Z0Y7_PATMI|nr:protein SHQ1 homolog [Patiria miniata]XP_038045327.1 protein SHQ1 homolog [Patiria miniata]